MLLKWILNVLAAILFFRLFRSLMRPRRPERPAPPPRSGLDPGRAVRAPWSEVREETEEESRR